MTNIIFIVGGDYQISRLFKEYGWGETDDINEATALCFTGGEDVSPLLYGAHPRKETYCNPDRDREEIAVLRSVPFGTPCIGICRGGQFLNVMAGGSMHQHVYGHTKTHMATDLFSGGDVIVTSTHHQMMFAANHGEILLVASEWNAAADVEAVWYSGFNYLCYQPHPEYSINSYCAKLFFKYIDKFIVDPS